VPLPAEPARATNANPVSENILQPDKDGQLSFCGLIFSPEGSRIYLANVDGSAVFYAGVLKDCEGLGAKCRCLSASLMRRYL